ncbi:MAG: DUF5683 domain-containing protein [Bacteroidota bacterium]
MKLKFSFTVLLTVLCLLHTKVDAQDVPLEDQPLNQEVTGAVPDTLLIENQSPFIPRRASLYSAIFPGLGQVYNKDYWKLPLVYGALIGLGIAVDFRNDRLLGLTEDLFLVIDGNDPVNFEIRTEQGLRNAIDQERRDRDYLIILTGVAYLLQIAEAHISAHLKEFKLNDNLKVSLEPDFEPIFQSHFSTGIALKFKF